MAHYFPGKKHEIDRLLAALYHFDIRIEAREASDAEAQSSFRMLDIRIGDREFTLPVEDEYGDAGPPSHPVILFHLLLRSMDFYREAEDFLVWCREFGLDPASPEAASWYGELRESAPFLDELFGPDLRPVSDWDYEMGTEVTEILRGFARKGIG